MVIRFIVVVIFVLSSISLILGYGSHGSAEKTADIFAKIMLLVSTFPFLYLWIWSSYFLEYYQVKFNVPKTIEKIDPENSTIKTANYTSRQHWLNTESEFPDYYEKVSGYYWYRRWWIISVVSMGFNIFAFL